MFKKLFYWLESNFWKFFIVLITERRNYITILSIYYLTLPNTQAFQVWIYTSWGYIASLILWIPMSYLADNIWHKKVIILSKIFLIISTFLIIIWDNFYYFFLASIFMSIWFAESILSAFIRDVLHELWRWREYKKIASKYKAYVSLLSVFIIIWLPFLTKIDIKLPFIITLFLDLIWFLVVLTLVSPKKEIKIEKPKKIFHIIKENKWNWLYPILIFSSIIAGFTSADQAFRGPYLESLWYPIIYIWFVMWLSRFVWFLVWKYIHIIEKYISFKKMIFIEIFMFSGYYILSYFLDNPYLVWIIFSLIIGYSWWRNEIYNDYFFENLEDKKYKSTILSIKNFLRNILQIGLWIPIGFVMWYSYKIWFLTLWIILLISLSITYSFIKIENK